MKKIASIFLLFTLAFTAHKYYLSLTQIEYNKNQNSLEVIINVFMDDIELAINKKYLRENLRFSINNKLVDYSFIGKEYEGDLVYFYLEVKVKDKPISLEVFNTILITYFDQQQNIIKFKNGSERQSKILSKNTNEALLNF
jgi:hypothetical protein